MESLYRWKVLKGFKGFKGFKGDLGSAVDDRNDFPFVFFPYKEPHGSNAPKRALI